MKHYLLYHMLGLRNDWRWFDPVSDLLLHDYNFVTWREVDQIAPPAMPMALVSRDSRKWCIQSLQPDKLGVFPKIERWLTPQLMSQLEGVDSLGPWEASIFRGMFDSKRLADTESWLGQRFRYYNGLVSRGRFNARVKMQPGRDVVELSFTEEGCLVQCLTPTRMPLEHVWEQVRPQLLDAYKQVQDTRLGLTA